MLHGKSPTLSWFSESPFLRPINLGSTPCEILAINCKAYLDALEQQESPERAALDFYCMNHLMAVVKAGFTPNEQLPDWALEVADVYRKVIERQGNRMLYYMVLITTRESRHVKSSTSSSIWDTVIKKYGKACKSFNQTIKGMGSTGAAEKFMAEPPKSELGNYISCLTYLFDHGDFSGGYGGKPWGQIARTLEQAITGHTSLEVMLDTAYTLAHNNGPMFNKGMLYEHYGHALYKILDVQRSGQIPELIRSGHLSIKPSADVLSALGSLVEEKPKLFDIEVDWQKVKDLGALKDYSSEIAKQAANKPKVTSSGHPITGQLYIMPGKAAKIYIRKSAA